MLNHYVTPSKRRRRSERGVVAVITAIACVALFVAGAMVVDIGAVRQDRQIDKSAADAAAQAGAFALNGNDSKSRPFRGVCAALQYLQQNAPRFAGVTDATGTWSDGNGVAKASGCTDATIRAQKCVAGSAATWARFSWSGTWQGTPLTVVIQGGYQLPGSGFSEETLSAVANDSLDTAQGCNQLAVIVTSTRKPGLGGVVRTANLATTIRSVARVKTSAGNDAPALLLTKQSGCPVLYTGSSAGTSYIHVYGAISSSGRTQPGSIHADSDGASCSQLFQGRGNDGIVAYAAPLSLASPTTPDPSKPGQITSVAGANGITGVVDQAAYAYASAARNEAGAAAATKSAPSGRSLVTRSVVDDRYLGLSATDVAAGRGVKGAVSAAQTNVFSTVTSKTIASGLGYKIIDGCTATSAEIAAIGANDNVYVNCTSNSGYSGTTPIPGKTIVFAGSVKPPNSAGATVSVPTADHVYVFGASGGDAISIGNNGGFAAHTTGNLAPSGACSSANSSSKAIIFVRAGGIRQTGGSLQMCYTTLVSMGGRADACLPATPGTAPTSAPCAGVTVGGSTDSGDGQLNGNNGTTDWTAPNQYDLMTDSDGNPLAALAPAWTDPNGPEDLAYWSESAGTNSNPTYSLGGSGTLHTVGVYMVPNADPFIIGGGSHQDLTNAQYVATTINLNGAGTSLSMSVDPNAAVTLPKLSPVGLVR